MNREFIEYLSARKNETLAVATILFTRGSTPRKAGTSMEYSQMDLSLVLSVVVVLKMKFA